MPINTNVIVVALAVLMLAFVINLFFVSCEIAGSIMWRWHKKDVCIALQNIMISYSVSSNFTNAISEVESIIKSIVATDKNFPSKCRSVVGLLTQYIQWLNLGKTPAISSETNITELKNTAHTLISKYKAEPISSEMQLYDEPLLNDLIKSIAAKDFEMGQKCIDELSLKISGIQKKSNRTYVWLSAAATIVGAVLSTVISKILG